MTANSYFEYVLTLLGWLVNNGVWQTLTATGLFALPLLANRVALWLKARGQGADEGNVARLLVVWVEHSLYSALLVILFAGIPFLNVDINTLTYDSQRTKQCGWSVVQPGDSGYAPLINELSGQNASVPVWWYFTHALGKGITSAAVAVSSMNPANEPPCRAGSTGLPTSRPENRMTARSACPSTGSTPRKRA